MTEYKNMYLHLFNSVTDAIDRIRNQEYEAAEKLLMDGQIACEEMYIESNDE